MAEKETSRTEAAARVDFLALEMEIDREIDSLFVPAIKKAQGTTAGPKAAGEAHSVSESKPAPEIQEPAGSSGARYDLDALQVEIDKEIDSLFVPAFKPGRNEGPVQTGNQEQPKAIQGMAPVVAEGPKAAGEAHNTPEPTPPPEIQEPAGSSGASYDLDALQVEMDKEIDSLFVPAFKPGRNERPVQIGNQEQPKAIQGMAPVVDEQDLKATRKAGGPSLGAFDGTTLRSKHDESPHDNKFDSQRYHFHELSKLIEMFNAAYLSLDWEFSRENIRKFLAALHQLEPFASRSADAGSVLRILEVILKRLQDKPHAVNSRLVQLIRNSQGLLAHMLLIEGETGPHEKQRLKDLIESFQELRQRALAVKAGAQRGRAVEITQPAVVGRAPQPPPEAQPALILSKPHKDSLQEFPELTAKAWRSLSDNLEIIDTQIARLRQIETILARTPVLVPIAQRLNGIGRALEDQVDTVRDKRGQLIARISRIRKPETAWSPGEVKTQKPEGDESLVQTTAQSEKAGRVVLHLMALDGHTLALPASCVLRVAHSSEKKGMKILKRGYATLADFKPYLRGIKSGVFAEWTKLPGKRLRSYRFELVALDAFNQAEAGGQMAVLASDGQKHAIIFAERVDFIADGEIEAREAVEALSHLLAPASEPCSQPFPPDQLSSASTSADRN